MDNSEDFYPLFPNSREEDEEIRFFGGNCDKNRSSASSERGESGKDDYEQQEIDEELLKKTSQLHEALRNIKLLRFQLIESKIMKCSNLNKCHQIEATIAKIHEERTSLKQSNEDLENKIQLYRQRVERQKTSNRTLETSLFTLNNQLIQTKIQHKHLMNKPDFSSILQDKENISGMENRRYISLEKIGLEAANHSAEEMIDLIKQQIISSKEKIKENQAKKLELQVEYKELLECLKLEQAKTRSARNRSINQQQVIHLQEVYEIGKQSKCRANEGKQQLKNGSKLSQKNPANQRKCSNTQNKQGKSSKVLGSTISTLKKVRIF